MHFIVIAKDGSDHDALNRRMASREAHIALGNESVKRGEHLLGMALLNDRGDMCGSVMLVDFQNRQALDEWLSKEPYVTGGVWKNIEVHECRIGPSFQHVIQSSVTPNLRVENKNIDAEKRSNGEERYNQ